MKNIKIATLLTFSIVIIGLVAPEVVFSQTKAKIQNVDFTQDGTKLIITYDIEKSKSNETFQIWIHVYTKSGRKILPNAITGDVGNNVMGGPYKKIVWDMEADQVFIDEDIYVDVYGQKESAKPEKKVVEEKKTQKKPVQKKTKQEGIGVAGAMGLSLALPGLGRRVVSGSGSAWLLGVVGYGCVGGALYLNNSAYTNYENYKSSTSTSMRDDYYTKAKNYDLYSKILIGSAATIWVVDLIMTGVKAGNAKKSSSDQRLSFLANYDPMIQQPVLGFSYKF